MLSYDRIWPRRALSKQDLVFRALSSKTFHNRFNSVNRFWRGMYGRFETGVHPREPLNDLLLASLDHTTSLEDHVQHLTKRIVNFKNLITNSAKRLQNASKLKVTEKAAEVNDNR